ncbi:uncharacterized protein LOC112569349 [Pomacea canaliculata]|uniref:uncharacterized protein LOC112569349 n=1 Tax=Pomacea canaliculata TaxID=400727 RepID=UPI000D726CA7|nr:uncharacterized protein LOC112569349 [Pomacea canaliculata]
MKIIILLGVVTAVLGYSYDDARIKGDFVPLDKNNDGDLTLDELFTYFLAGDENGNGKISLREFADGLRPGNYSQDITRAAYEFYDKMDGTTHGFLDPFTVLHLFKLFDDDNNQKVSLGEFLKAAREIIQISAHETGVTI